MAESLSFVAHNHKPVDIIKKILLWTIGLTTTGAVLLVLFALFCNYSGGERVGHIIKISKKGYLFKTWEGQLNTGEIQQGLWEFSVKQDDTEILDQLREAMKIGNRVALHYDEKYVSLPFLGDTKNFITEVELLDD
ncbi:6-phosphogluconate dehydrogenase [Bacteroidia bacterium]|nr:6-phosphogluconate dehydrogenase [Bacteroidia bacterium]